MSRALRRHAHWLAFTALILVSLVHAVPSGIVGNVAQSAEKGASYIKAAADNPLPRWLPEIVIACFLLAYTVNIWRGRASNEDLAVAFVDTFAPEGALLERNFSQIGARIQGAPDIILRESMHRFLLFATGRRFCQSFQATLNLKHRQDLLYMLSYCFAPSQDALDIEIPMNESSMQPLVLLIASPRQAKSLAKTLPDVQSLARPIDIDRRRLPNFPSDKLAVWAESSGIFYDLMTDRILDLIFGRAAFEDAARHFQYLHFTSESPEGQPRHVLRFSFSLPPKDQLTDLTKLLTAAVHFIDVVGSHELSSEARDKAAKRREQLAAAEHKITASERLEAQQQKRQEKKDEEKEKLKRMTPEQRQKYKDRQERVQNKRAMKSRMIRI